MYIYTYISGCVSFMEVSIINYVVAVCLGLGAVFLEIEMVFLPALGAWCGEFWEFKWFFKQEINTTCQLPNAAVSILFQNIFQWIVACHSCSHSRHPIGTIYLQLRSGLLITPLPPMCQNGHPSKQHKCERLLLESCSHSQLPQEVPH